jgi:hypothetical protein
MRLLIPLLDGIKRQQVKETAAGRRIFISFDGATDEGDLISLIGHWCGDDHIIQQKLLELVLHESSVDGNKLFFVLSTLNVVYGFDQAQVAGTGHDAASVNLSVLPSVRVLWPKSIDLQCLSHMLQRTGERTDVPLV